MKASTTMTVNAVFSMGQYIYSNRPTGVATQDNSTEVVAEDRTIYWENYRIGGMPQSAASLGLRYDNPKYWSIGANVNWFGDMYLDPNPARRTAEALQGLVTDDPQWDALLEQEQLDNGLTVDAFFMKSWMIQRKYRIAFNASVTNLFDMQDIVSGGFEQLRFDAREVDKFPPKYSYMYGRTYYAMLTFSF
jgi:hypothetical protein